MSRVFVVFFLAPVDRNWDENCWKITAVRIFRNFRSGRSRPPAASNRKNGRQSCGEISRWEKVVAWVQHIYS